MASNEGDVVLARFCKLRDRKSTRLNSSHSQISYAVFCLKKKMRLPVRRTSEGGLDEALAVALHVAQISWDHPLIPEPVVVAVPRLVLPATGYARRPPRR